MGTLRQFLSDFIRNDGGWVVLSNFITKIAAFLTTLWIIRIFSAEDFGYISVAASIFTMFASFTGFGMPVALLNLNAFNKTNPRKVRREALFLQGIFYHLLITVIFIAASFVLLKDNALIYAVIAAYTVRFFGMFLIGWLQSSFRVDGNNAAFAKISLTFALLHLFLTIVLCRYLNVYGFLISLAVTPFITVVCFSRTRQYSGFIIEWAVPKEIWKFAAHVSFANFFSELLFSADILLLGYLMNEPAVADYRVAILVPSNIIFLAQSVLQSDYVKIAERSFERVFLVNYVKQYYKLFVPTILAVCLVSFLFKDDIIALLFGGQYTGVGRMFVILMAAFSICILGRVFFGNMLAAVGRMSDNTLSAVIGLMVVVFSGYFLVQEFGPEGMAYAMLLSMISFAVVGALQWSDYLRKLA